MDDVETVKLELRKVWEAIDLQIEQVNLIAHEMNIDASKLRLTDGSFMLAPLLVGKAQVLNALVYLDK